MLANIAISCNTTGSHDFLTSLVMVHPNAMRNKINVVHLKKEKKLCYVKWCRTFELILMPIQMLY